MAKPLTLVNRQRKRSIIGIPCQDYLITSIGATSNSPNHPALVMAKIIDNGTVAFDIANLDGVAINTEGFYWWVEGY